MANIPDIPDITHAHPDYPELLSKNQLKKRWLKWIKSCQDAQETSEKWEGHMKEQINILKKAINRGDLVNAAEIPVNGDVKKFINRDAVERGKKAGIGARKVNAQTLLTTQQREKKQNTHPNQTEARRRQQSPAERILELENSGYNNSNGNFQRLFDESEEERKKRLSFDLPGPVSWKEWEKWNQKARARKGGKKRKRRKTKRKKSRRRKTKKRKRKTKKRKRKTKKRK